MSPIRRFLQLESSGGIVLFMMAVLAMLIANSPLRSYYHLLFELKLTIGVGQHIFAKKLLVWINDGLMAVFFLLIGLEVKRELLEGELNSFSKAVLPAIAAAGGMLMPALIYVCCNWGNSISLHGWGIPTATDIAFSLGILSLLGSRIPQSLKIFLLALAIFDDIGAIIVIAVFYSGDISVIMLLIAAGLVGVLILFNRLNIVSRAPYMLVGFIIWACVFKSGVHATLAGVVVALTIPLRDRNHRHRSPLRDLEKSLHPWVAFGVLPLFALANAGVSFRGESWGDYVGPVSVGIILGLFFGKQLGIFGATALAIKLKLAVMPKDASFLGLYGIALIGGVGFTMSLFIGSLAFLQFNLPYADDIRFGVIVGSLVSASVGYSLLRYIYQGKQSGEVEE